MAEKKPETTPAGKRLHRATYARDKRKGGYIVRVQGPRAGEFAGRTVPVSNKAGDEHMEQLTDLIWTGTDDGSVSGYTGPCALYSFLAHPREELDTIPF